MPDRHDVLRVAIAVVERALAGDAEATCHGVNFDLLSGGYCERFVRQCHEAAGVPFPYAADTAAHTERNLKAAGLATTNPQPGDIMCLTEGAPGHIAIYGWLLAVNGSNIVQSPNGVSCVLENTSSGRRGNPRRAGTKITPLNTCVGGRTPRYYHVA